MKYVKKVLVIFCVISCHQASAQKSFIGIGPELNIPSGNSSSIAAIGYGAGLKLEIGLAPKTALTFSGSYNAFGYNGNGGLKGTAIQAVPLKAGFKYYTSPSFYLEGQVGSSLHIEGSGSSGLAWSPGIGALIKTKNSENCLDVGLRYESWARKNTTVIGSSTSTFSFIGVRIAYAFSL